MRQFLRNAGIYLQHYAVSRLMSSSSGMPVSIYNITQCHVSWAVPPECRYLSTTLRSVMSHEQFLRNAGIYLQHYAVSRLMSSSSGMPVSIYNTTQCHVSWAVPPECRYLSTRLRSVTSHETVPPECRYLSTTLCSVTSHMSSSSGMPLSIYTRLHVLLDVNIDWSCYAAAQCLVNALTYRITCCIQILIRSRSCLRTTVPCKLPLFHRRFKGPYSFQVQEEVTNQWFLPTRTAGLSVINSLRRWRQHGSPKQTQHSPKKVIT